MSWREGRDREQRKKNSNEQWIKYNIKTEEVREVSEKKGVKRKGIKDKNMETLNYRVPKPTMLRLSEPGSP